MIVYIMQIYIKIITFPLHPFEYYVIFCLFHNIHQSKSENIAEFNIVGMHGSWRPNLISDNLYVSGYINRATLLFGDISISYATH